MGTVRRLRGRIDALKLQLDHWKNRVIEANIIVDRYRERNTLLLQEIWTYQAQLGAGHESEQTHHRDWPWYVQRTLRSLRQRLNEGDGGTWELYPVRIIISPFIIPADIAPGHRVEEELVNWWTSDYPQYPHRVGIFLEGNTIWTALLSTSGDFPALYLLDYRHDRKSRCLDIKETNLPYPQRYFNITGRQHYEGLRTYLVRDKYSPHPGIHHPEPFQRAIAFISTALTQLDELERSVNRDFDIQGEVLRI
jgi:hypothetical protein